MVGGGTRDPLFRILHGTRRIVKLLLLEQTSHRLPVSGMRAIFFRHERSSHRNSPRKSGRNRHFLQLRNRKRILGRKLFSLAKSTGLQSDFVSLRRTIWLPPSRKQSFLFPRRIGGNRNLLFFLCMDSFVDARGRS